MDFKSFICFFSVFQLASCMLINEVKPGHIENKFRYIKTEYEIINSNDYLSDENLTFRLRTPHYIGQKLCGEDVVIRTFPTEVNQFHENTEYTKNVSLQLERSCGSSKSSFDKTDVVMLTLIEKDLDNVTSHIIKSIRVDPLSVDFYPRKLAMKQFERFAQFWQGAADHQCLHICQRPSILFDGQPAYLSPYFKENCAEIFMNNCTFSPREVDYSQMLAEMEKFITTLKYLLLFRRKDSPTCQLLLKDYLVVLELDNKTASLFPKLTKNHYFIATFVDAEKKQTITRQIDECRILLD
uniref:Uncharacterized protein n=1 Tax=Tetranychus urticae TaxID=32264 RepID=T1JWE4_TETUR